MTTLIYSTWCHGCGKRLHSKSLTELAKWNVRHQACSWVEVAHPENNAGGRAGT